MRGNIMQKPTKMQIVEILTLVVVIIEAVIEFLK